MSTDLASEWRSTNPCLPKSSESLQVVRQLLPKLITMTWRCGLTTCCTRKHERKNSYADSSIQVNHAADRKQAEVKLPEPRLLDGVFVLYLRVIEKV